MGECIPDVTKPNKRGAGNGAVALCFQSARPGRAVPDHGRSAVMRRLFQ